METISAAPAPTKPETNTYAVTALALIVLPTLATLFTREYLRSSQDLRWGFWRSGGDDAVLCYTAITVVTAINLAIQSYRRHPGLISTIAVITTMFGFLFLCFLPVLLS